MRLNITAKKVSAAERVKTCGCMDHVQRGPICKHAGAVLLSWVRDRAAEKKRVQMYYMGSDEEESFPPYVPEGQPIPIASASSAVLRAVAAGPVAHPGDSSFPVVPETGVRRRANSTVLVESRIPPALPAAPKFEAASCFAALREKAMRLGKATVIAGPSAASASVPSSAPMPAQQDLQAAACAAAVEEEAEEANSTLGELLAVLDAKASQEAALDMIGSAGQADEIVLLGFSLDRDDLVQALVGAKKRGCSVRVTLDPAMTLQGRTRDQLSSAKSLVAAGISVRVVDGVPLEKEYAAVGRRVAGHLRGIQHAKAVLVGRTLLAGSCNFTTSSRSNWEVGLQVTLKHPAVVQEFMLAAWHSGTDLSEAQISEAQRARSASPSGRGRR